MLDDLKVARENREYLRYLFARAQSEFGTGVTEAALPLLAAVTLHASTEELGSLVATASAGQLVSRPFAAVRAERAHSLGGTLRAMEWARFLTVIAIPVLWFTGTLTIWLLLVLTGLTSICTGIFGGYSAPYLVDLVAPEELAQAGSLLGSANETASVVGPGVAGALLRIISLPTIFIVDAVTYLIGGALLGSKVARPRSKAEVDGEGSLKGFMTFFTARMSAPVLGLMAGTLLNGATLAVLAIYATRVLYVSPSTYASVVMVGAIGGIVGAGSAGWFAQHLKELARYMLAFGMLVAALVVLPFAHHGIVAVLCLTSYEFIGSFGGALYMVTLIISIPSVVPRETIARSMATAALIPELSVLVGSLAGGAVAERVGIHSFVRDIAYAAVGSACLVGIVGGLNSLHRGRSPAQSGICDSPTCGMCRDIYDNSAT